MKRYLFLGAFLCSLLYSSGQDGSLDTSFATKGWTHTYFFTDNSNFGDETGLKTFIQSDGKYLVVFNFYYTTMLARYNPNGTLDKTYGDNGFSANTEMGDFNPIDAVLQSDGKIVLGGQWYNGDNYDFALLRLNPDGTVDTTIGPKGISTAVDFFGSYDTPTSMAIQSDGKILLGGNAFNPDGNYDFALTRFHSDGKIDSSFGIDGKATTNIYTSVSGNTDDYVNAVAIQNDGKIILAGYSYIPNPFSYDDVALVRYKPDGSLDIGDGSTDPGFGTGGIVRTDFGDAFADANAVAIQSDGKIIVAGNLGLNDNATFDFLLVRYTAAGVLDIASGEDPGFGTGGIVTTHFDSTNAFAKSMAIQADGKIVAAGILQYPDNVNLGLARYNTDGTLDTTFDKDGKTTTDFGSPDDFASSLVLQSDGKIIVTGKANIGSDGNSDFILARYTTDGNLDPTFAASGILDGYLVFGASTIFSGIATQKDGKIVVAGIGNNLQTGNDDLSVARYNPDGTLDGTFGTGGIASTNFGANYYISDSYLPVSVAIGGDGKIVLGLSVDNGMTYNRDFGLVRFTATGMLDNALDSDGKVTTSFGMTADLGGIAIQSDGKIIVGGRIGYSAENSGFTVVRYTASGALDNSFGTGGKAVVDFFGLEENSWGVAIQSDGKIVAAGSAMNKDGYSDFALARFTTSGRLDNTFGNRGKVTTSFGDKDDFSGPLVLQPDGKIVLLGISYDSIRSNVALARYTTGGSLDGTFGSGGKMTTYFSNYDNFLFLALQSDGRIVLSGTVPDTVTFSNNLNLLRFTSSGVPDSSFGTAGRASTQFTFGDFYPIAWNSNRIYAAGRTQLSYNDAGLLAAFKAGSTSTIPVVNINDVTVSAYQAAVTAKLTISATGTISSPLTVNYATQDGTATSKGRNADYKPTKGAVVLTSTASSATINIPVNASAFNDGKKYFNVNLSLSRQMSSLATIGKGTGVVTIEPAPGFAKPVTSANNQQIQESHGKLSAKAYPNPSNGYFTLQLQSASTEPATIKVTDVSARIIETKAGVVANGSILLGTSYRAGVYYVQIEQGSEKLTIKLVKQ